METKSISYKSIFNPLWNHEKQDIIHPNSYESVLELPKDLGDGEIRSIEIREGMAIEFVDQRPNKSIYLEREDQSNFLELAFFLSGQMNVQMVGSNELFAIEAGVSCISMSRPQMLLEFPENIHTVYMAFFINPTLLNPLLQDNRHLLPDSVSRLITGADGDQCGQPGQISPSIQIVLQQIQNCPYQGSLRHLYLEGKTLELLALYFEQTYLGKPVYNGSPALRSQDIERIHYAKEILNSNMENPPSLLELAKQVGINDFKLKKGFREVTGNTVFGYLREQRMDKARLLLEEGKMNVTEVAFEVGYQHLSHFASLFKKRFGVYPGSYHN